MIHSTLLRVGEARNEVNIERANAITLGKAG